MSCLYLKTNYDPIGLYCAFDIREVSSSCYTVTSGFEILYGIVGYVVLLLLYLCGSTLL